MTHDMRKMHWAVARWVVLMAARTTPAVSRRQSAASLNPPPEPASADAQDVRRSIEQAVSRVPGEHWSHAAVELRSTHTLHPRRLSDRTGYDADDPSLWWG